MFALVWVRGTERHSRAEGWTRRQGRKWQRAGTKEGAPGRLGQAGCGQPQDSAGVLASCSQICQGQRLHGGVVGLPGGKQGPGQTRSAPQEGLMEGWGLGVCSMGTRVG